MIAYLKSTIFRLASWLKGASASQHEPENKAEYRARYLGLAPAVKGLIEAIEANLPDQATDPDIYKQLSPGQKALAEAIVYLEYQRLEQARSICAEALGDPACPGDQWVIDLIAAIDLAIKMPENSIEAGASKRALKAERRRLANAAQLRMAKQAVMDLED